MITKNQYKSKGFKIKESGVQVQDERLAKIEQIKSIIPSLVNSDGAVDLSALDDMLGNKNLASTNQGYSLNFAGKGLAKIKVDIPTEKELKVEIKQSKNFDTTENVVIRGDNIDVLKILRQNYTGKIKMIYIDPPYNTGQANFIYPDRFKVNEKQLIKEFGLEDEAIDFLDNMLGTTNHSSWMFEMYPRLRLAMDLLTDDGIIFISIDDNEQANLKIMCDEVFGEENLFLVGVVNRPSEIASGNTISKHEYFLIYAKDSSKSQITSGEKYTISRGTLGNELQTMPVIKFPKGMRCLKVADGEYEKTRKIKDSNENIENLDPIIVKNGELVEDVRLKARWRSSNDMRKFFSNNCLPTEAKINGIIEEIYLEGDRFIPQIKKKTIEKIPSLFLENKRGSKDLEALDMKGVFDNPKSVNFLRNYFFYLTEKEDIILDFFAGSGTTAQAVMELNKEDNGNRKFILAQIDEPIDKQLPAYKFCDDNEIHPVISSICIERVDRAGDNLKKQSDMLNEELDIGYKVFSLTPRPELITGVNNHLELNVSRATAQDTLYNMMAASGEVILTISIEEIEANLLYKVADSYYVLGECKTSLDEFSSNRIYIDGYANINLENWLNIIGLNKENVTILY